jgi:dipeptidyl aminopeptidase/acylaminoacyl peptidase
MLALLFFVTTQTSARSFQLEDFDNVIDLGSPAIAPNGEWIAYTVTSVNTKADAKATDIWCVSWDGKKRVAITKTPKQNEWSPLWSPDGKWLAFLSDRNSRTTQVWVVPSDGGKAREVTQMPAGVKEFVWSPDSKQLALIAEDEPHDAIPGAALQPIVTDRFYFKDDERGYLGDRYSHVYVFDIASKRTQQITRGAHDEQLLSWSPDGKWLAYVTKRIDRALDPDRHINFDIYIVAPESGAVEKQITTFTGIDSDPYWVTTPAWSPDSKALAYLQGGEQKWTNYAPSQLAIVDIDSRQSRLPAQLDRNFYKAKWSTDGKFVYTLVEQSRNTYLAKIDVQSGDVKYLTSGKRFDVDVDVVSDRVALLGGDDSHPPQLSAIDPSLRLLADHNDWLRNVELALVEDMDVNVAGGAQLHAMLLRPVSANPGERLPTIVKLHGGPVYQFSHEFISEWQYLAAQGFAVVLPNPRGSSGRGFEFAKAIFADWGKQDSDDVIAILEHVTKIGVADPSRVAVGGWSYGGMLTNYVIARYPRFKAAFSGAGSGNALSLYGHDQYVREVEFELGKPWEHLDRYLNLSDPFIHADRIKTPTLFLCAQLDFNVPCLGAEQMYQALQSQKIPTRLIVYPEEHHSLERPSFVRHRAKSYVEWIRRFID